MTKVKRNTGIPVRHLKGNAMFDHVKFARKLASCNRTTVAGSYMRNHNSLLNPANEASQYISVDDFRHDYLLYNVLRKFNDATEAGALSRADKAFSKFIDVDEKLSELNRTLSFSFLALNEPVAHRILYRAARKIERLLGPVNLEEISDACSFSHGATALHPRVRGRAPFKFSFENPEVTPECARLACYFVNQSPLWGANLQSFTLVGGNRLTTVPKDADIDRVIACEPTMNMYVQKGIGAVMRRRLKRVNIDLDDQTVNQRLARIGSRDGSLATVDLSAASDSIGLAICKLLLPEAWYDLLLTTRSDIGILPDGSEIRYSKISSMGNGFTFELESLLFWAITQACEDECALSRGVQTHRCSVYGDDIICQSYTVPILKSVLELCGFSLNDDKSFTFGPFRESCGKHYFNGVDVSPFFIRNPIGSILDLIGLCNRLRRWSRQTLGVDDPRYVDLYYWSVSFLPKFWQKPRLPDGFGDGALYGSLDEVKPSFKNGVYHAATISVNEKRVTDSDKRFRYFEQIYLGLGGYLEALSDLSRKKPSLKQRLAVSGKDVALRLNQELRLPVPGTYVNTLCKVKIYEWSDQC